MTLETRIIALANAVGADIKALKAADGALSGLTTTAKDSLVAAINELHTLMGQGGGGASTSIDDAAGNGATAVTWSADKIYDTIEAAKTAVKNDLTAGASAALDTLAELAVALGNDPSFAATIATALTNRVRFDAAQTLDAAQKAQVNTNIGAASLVNTGDLDRDLAAAYTAAKA